jgi:hypothetical protein
MRMLKFLTELYTLVLAQRTPVKAAFWTIGLDRTLEERRIELPKRSEEAMVVCAQWNWEKGGSSARQFC